MEPTDYNRNIVDINDVKEPNNKNSNTNNFELINNEIDDESVNTSLTQPPSTSIPTSPITSKDLNTLN